MTPFTRGILAATLLAGCAVDEPIDADLAETTAQAFTLEEGYALSGGQPNAISAGSGRARACFLSGIAGDLGVTTAHPQAGAGVRLVDGHWELYIEPAKNLLTARTRCVNGTGLTSAQTWSTGQAKVLLAAATPTKRCFLTEIRTGRNGTYSNAGFNSLYDQVIITQENGGWYLSGNSTGLITATARCLDITNDLGLHINWANPGSTSTIPLSTAANGATCWLVQLNGRMYNYDAAQGPLIQKVLGSQPTQDFDDAFALTNKDGNGAGARCVR